MIALSRTIPVHCQSARIGLCECVGVSFKSQLGARLVPSKIRKCEGQPNLSTDINIQRIVFPRLCFFLGMNVAVIWNCRDGLLVDKCFDYLCHQCEYSVLSSSIQILHLSHVQKTICQYQVQLETRENSCETKEIYGPGCVFDVACTETNFICPK